MFFNTILSLIVFIKIAAIYAQNSQYSFNVSTCNLNNYGYCSTLYYIKYRTIDGSCNNVAKPWMGMSNTPYQRFSIGTSSYSDSNGSPRKNGINGKPLPSPRQIALSVLYPNDIANSVSLFHLFFGKMVGHDVSEAGQPQDQNGRNIICGCNDNSGNCLIIPTSPTDTVNQDQSCMATPRTIGSLFNWNCGSSFREQINRETAWLDLSVLYSYNNASAQNLRTFSNGQLNSQILPGIDGAVFSSAGYPANAYQCLRDTLSTPCFASGDKRLNMNTGLTSVQVLFLRQHNYIAAQLQALSATAGWSEDKLFQSARRLNIAIYQHVLYNEWLPILLGPSLTNSFNLKPQTSGTYLGYNAVLVDQVINEFAAAAFRFGHNMVPNQLNKADQNYNNFASFNLTSFTYTPTDAYINGGLNSICRGLLNTPSINPDTYHSDQIHNHLFDVGVAQGNQKRASLTAFNIQRGRDHGLRSYNSYRSSVGLNTAQQFNDLLSNISPAKVTLLQSV